jgi:hypothetical protein
MNVAPPKRKRRWFRWTVTIVTGLALLTWIASAWYQVTYRAWWVTPKDPIERSDGRVLFDSDTIELGIGYGGVYGMARHVGENTGSTGATEFLIKRLPDVPAQSWLARFGLRSLPYFGEMSFSRRVNPKRPNPWVVAVPFWIVAIPLFAITVRCWWGAFSKRQPNDCPSCGYSLIGNLSGRCPECGKEVLSCATEHDA